MRKLRSCKSTSAFSSSVSFEKSSGEGGHIKEAVQNLQLWQQKGNRITAKDCGFILQACARVKALSLGKLVHGLTVRGGLEQNSFVASHLVNMYVKCGRVRDAHRVFDFSPKCRNVLAWTSLISGYAKDGHGQKALELFFQMQWESIRPNQFTFVTAINACASSKSALDLGKQLHHEILATGFASNIFINNALVDMYTKLGCLEDALQTFVKMPVRDVVSWNTIIMGFTCGGQGGQAFKFYQQMQREGLAPDRITFISILNACVCLNSSEQGNKVHLHILERGLDRDVFVGSALVNMYAKCGSMENAEQVFNNMQEKNVVSWSVMIAEFAKDGHGKKALELFQKMKREGIKPNEITFVAVLNACARLSALVEGKWIHKQIVESGFQTNVFLGSSLIDMYAKCADLIQARKVFDEMTFRNVVCWNAMVTAYAIHGHFQEASQLCGQIQMEALGLESVTLISVISACSHIGLVDQGVHYFCSLKEHDDVELLREHYGCIVDLLSRAGHEVKGVNVIC